MFFWRFFTASRTARIVNAVQCRQHATSFAQRNWQNSCKILVMPQAAFSGISSFSEYDGMGLAELVRRKQATPHELLGWAMTNAEAVNPRINCLAHIHYEEAR